MYSVISPHLVHSSIGTHSLSDCHSLRVFSVIDENSESYHMGVFSVNDSVFCILVYNVFVAYSAVKY